jgi:hypothetical protein
MVRLFDATVSQSHRPAKVRALASRAREITDPACPSAILYLCFRAAVPTQRVLGYRE